jgi:hypothetical protein
MGLTIHYKLSLARGSGVLVERLVARLHAIAKKAYPTRTGVRLYAPTTDAAELNRWGCACLTSRDPDAPDTVHAVSVPPIEGCIFPVSIGQDCEVLWLGLCRYPATIQVGDAATPTGQAPGWRFSGACKTQYASLHGWGHFLRCHTTVVGLLRLAVELGVHVRISDEGSWWPHRSDSALRQALELKNQLVAAVGGALKDYSGDDEPCIASPIFAHPDFERLEAAGVARRSNAVECARREITKLRTPGVPD